MIVTGHEERDVVFLEIVLILTVVRIEISYNVHDRSIRTRHRKLMGNDLIITVIGIDYSVRLIRHHLELIIIARA